MLRHVSGLFCQVQATGPGVVERVSPLKQVAERPVM